MGLSLSREWDDMDKGCVLGIDIGTSSCKVYAVDAAGRLLGVAGTSCAIRSPQPGWSEQDPHEWLPAIEAAVAQLFGGLTNPRPDVAALALSSAAHIAVLLDADDEPVRDAILWNDQRAGVEAAHLVDELGAFIFEHTCNQGTASSGWEQAEAFRSFERVPRATPSSSRIRVCDVFGQPVQVNPDADSAYGAALLALESMSMLPRPQDPGAGGKHTSVLLPDPKTSRRYAEGFVAYRAIHERLRDCYHDAAISAKVQPV